MDRPLFTVVMPTYNRVEALRIVLTAYERQLPADLPFEVVVVDDGSSDSTRELLATWRPERFQLRLFSQPNAGPAAARNRALDMVSGDLVLFTGDDIEPASDLLVQHWRGHVEEHDPGTAILGLTRWPDAAPVTATMRHVDGVGAQQFSYCYLDDGAEYDFRHFYTSNVSARRELLELEAAGFSTDFPAAAFEDAEYSYRLSLHGMRIVYRAAAEAFHHHPYDVASFFRRQVRCGQMATVLFDKRPYLKRWCGVRDAEWARLRLLVGDSAERKRVAHVERDLAAWEGRILALAGFYDHGPEEPLVDDLLLPLFQYAFLKGVAGALYDEGVASRVCAALYLRLLPQAVRRFVTAAHLTGVPVPVSDSRVLATIVEQGRERGPASPALVP